MARTIHAQQSFEFSDVFSYKFSEAVYGVNRHWKIQLINADGLSTSGGKTARQSLVLVPERGGGNMVVGWVDAPAKRGEVRGFNVLQSQFKARYDKALDLEQEEYEDLAKDLLNFFRFRKIEVEVKEKAAPRAPSVAMDDAPSAGSSLIVYAALAVGVFTGLGFLAFGV